MRSRSAPVWRSLAKTEVHSWEGRFEVTIVAPFSYRRLKTSNSTSLNAAHRTSGHSCPCRIAECCLTTQRQSAGIPPAHHQELGGAFCGARSRGPERVRTAPHPQPGARHANLGNPSPRLHQAVVPVPHPRQPAPFRLDAAGMPPALGGHPRRRRSRRRARTLPRPGDVPGRRRSPQRPLVTLSGL